MRGVGFCLYAERLKGFVSLIQGAQHIAEYLATLTVLPQFIGTA